MPESNHNGSTLKRLLGMPSVIAVGVGIAIGSGIFRVPGEIAEQLHSPGMILLAWAAAGLITMIQSLVNAELSTRYPQAGGEYQYLKSAYGEFAAFLFGWCCTIFISGAGIAAIAASLGDFAASLLGRDGWNHAFGSIAIVAIVGVNCLGLRSGAVTQTLLTTVKVVALFGIAAGAIWYCGRATPAPVDAASMTHTSAGGFVAATLLAYWCFTGATDSVRLAEEVHDTRKLLPRALIATTLLVAIVYMTYNYALLCAASPPEMAGREDAHTLAFIGSSLPISELILITSIIVCIGAISAALLANSRVVFAMARDRLAFQPLAWMSNRQAPIPALMLIGAIAIAFTWNRSFGQILRIYFLGSAILFGLVYFSLFVFRRREAKQATTDRDDVYRLPFAGVLVSLLLVLEAAIAVKCMRDSPTDSMATLGTFVVIAIAYGIVRRSR